MIERICPNCDQTYLADPVRLRHGRQTTCSRKCSYALRGKNRFRSTTKPCGVCGDLVTRPPSHIKAKADDFFCSRTCHYKGRTLGLVGREVTKPYNIPDEVRQANAERLRQRNAIRAAEGRYTVSEATRQKLRITTSKAIAEGRIPRVSKLEVEVGVVLNDLRITNQPQYGIRGDKGRFIAVLDYFLPDLNSALEVNGTFWHADPRVFPNGPEHASQRRTATRYETKRQHLVRLGIPLLELWEMDFRANPEEAVKDVLGLA